MKHTHLMMALLGAVAGPKTQARFMETERRELKGTPPNPNRLNKAQRKAAKKERHALRAKQENPQAATGSTPEKESPVAMPRRPEA